MLKKLFLIDDTLANKVSYYHVMLIMLALPFDQFFSHVFLGSFILHTLFQLKKDDVKQLFTLRNGILQATFFVTLISIVYSAYPAIGATDIIRQLVILLFPLVFSISHLNIAKYYDNLLYIFSMVCAVIIAFLYLHALYVIHYYHLPITGIFTSLFINHKFSLPLDIHATFFSLQIAIAFFYVFVLTFKTRSSKVRFFYSTVSLLLFAGIVQLGSKAIMLVTLFGILVAVPRYIIPAGKRLRYIFISAALSLLVGCSFLGVKAYRDRYVKSLKDDLSAQNANESVEPRVVRWKAAFELVKEKPVFGYGAGSELKILTNKYFNEKLYISYLNRLNAHNQYITFLLITGIVGLLVYLATLYFGFNMALTQSNILFLIFMLLITVVSFSESLLNAEKGIFFYAFFFSFFVFSALNKHQKAI